MKKFFLFIFAMSLLTLTASFTTDTIVNTVVDTTIVDTLQTDMPVFDGDEITAPVETTKDTPSFFAVVLPAILGIIGVLFSDTAKHFADNTWDKTIFMSTKIKPALISLAVILAVWGLSIPDNFIANLIIKMFGDNVAMFSLGFAGTISAVIDGLLKGKTLQV